MRFQKYNGKSAFLKTWNCFIVMGGWLDGLVGGLWFFTPFNFLHTYRIYRSYIHIIKCIVKGCQQFFSFLLFYFLFCFCYILTGDLGLLFTKRFPLFFFLNGRRHRRWKPKRVYVLIQIVVGFQKCVSFLFS